MNMFTGTNESFTAYQEILRCLIEADGINLYFGIRKKINWMLKPITLSAMAFPDDLVIVAETAVKLKNLVKSGQKSWKPEVSILTQMKQKQ